MRNVRKKTALGILFILFNVFCYGQSVTLSSQAAVNNFATNYPGDSTFDSITIGGSDITNLNGLSQVTDVTGDLFITTPSINNSPLTDISGLNNLITVGGRLTLFNLKFLNATNLFPNLREVGSGVNGDGLFIVGFTPANISGFNALFNVSGDLAVQNTIYLVTLTGFNALTKVKPLSSNNQAMLYFSNNRALTNINGFGILNEISWDYFFINNPSLVALPNTPLLTIIGKTLTINKCHSLVNFNGINNLTTIINGNLNISQNDNLSSLDGLDSLSICYGIGISSCPSLVDITALSSLTTFNEVSNRAIVNISDNSSLSSLTGLDNINGATIGNVVLQNNPNLTLCAVESFCEKIAFDTNLGGFTNVDNNATNCNSAAEINAVCQFLSTNEITENSHFAISPNPANAILHLQFQNGITINKLMIRDITGKLIVEQLDDVAKINVERLAKGIYILEAHSSEKNYQTRFVKE
ncbi:MAG: T9SS type A sorting domain-containing protein [Flavobacterium sp.]|nr:T9SS type A sorting domain-containing protein [Flavobacterium sp.]